METGEDVILALDEGTSSAKAFVFDDMGEILGEGRRPLRQRYPRPGWVEHDPDEIWTAMQHAIREALQSADVTAGELAAVGVTNQRETVMLWNRADGRPLANAIVWQDRRTAPAVEELDDMQRDMVHGKTGLIPDAYFSASKLGWLLDSLPDGRRNARDGEIACGTVDSWLIWQLTGGEVHATDCSNASRTMLYDIHRQAWDDELLELFDLPGEMLPAVHDSSHRYGHALLDGCQIPITGCAGDQQAALFGQRCTTPGMVKNTYGTGNFILMCMDGCHTSSRLLTTVAWRLDGRVTYALEGSMFATGAGVQWLQQLGLLDTVDDVEALAASVDDTGGVYLVPAFVGLGAPYWDATARGTLTGLSGGVDRAVLARAALEAIAYLSEDVVGAMEAETGDAVREMRVDGGGSRNNLLMQFQADISRHAVLRPRVMETTALGVAMFAGLQADVWESQRELDGLWQEAARYQPQMSEETRDVRYHGWKQAVERARGWTTDLQPAGDADG
ncbi:MAG: glycerol kinase GlpK [Thermoplasmatota archaeon]